MHIGIRRRFVRDLMERIGTVKEGRGLLQRPVLRLHDKEPQEHNLECEPAYVHELSTREGRVSVAHGPQTQRATHIVFPPQRVQRDRVHVLVKYERDRDDKIEEAEALGTEMEWQDLDCVRNGERGERERIRRRIEKDECDHGVARCGRPVLSIFCKAYRLCHVEQRHQTCRGEDEGSTAVTIEGGRGVQPVDEAPDLDHAVDKQLRARTRDADLVQHF